MRRQNTRTNKNYIIMCIDFFLPENLAMPLEIGDSCVVYWGGAWWPANMLKVNLRSYHVTFQGFGAEWNKTYPRHHVRRKAAESVSIQEIATMSTTGDLPEISEAETDFVIQATTESRPNNCDNSLEEYDVVSNADQPSSSTQINVALISDSENTGDTSSAPNSGDTPTTTYLFSPRKSQRQQNIRFYGDVSDVSSNSDYSDSDDNDNDEIDESMDEQDGSSDIEVEQNIDGQRRWSTRTPLFSDNEWKMVRETANQIRSPLQYITDYLTDEFLETVIGFTNLKARQINPNSNFFIGENDLILFIAVTYYMSLFGVTNVRRCWKNNSRLSQVADNITVNRYEELKRYISFADSTQEHNSKIFKFEYLVNHFREVAIKIPRGECFSVDEQIIPSKTKKSSLRQYNPQKPKKWGYKMFMMCGEGGIVSNLEFYAGKREEIRSLPHMQNLLKSSQVVARLCEVLEDHKNYKVFFDNWFSSIDLLVFLAKRGILSLSTLQIRREKGLLFPDDRSMKLQGGRGMSVSKCTVVDGIEVTAVKWLDNRSVTLASTFVGSEPKSDVERFDRLSKKKIQVEAPCCVQTYNKHMGFVDSIDSYLARFRIKVNCGKRHYLKIFFHFLDLFVVNSWLLYRRDCQDISMPKKQWLTLWDFKAAIAQELVQKSKSSRSPLIPQKRRSSLQNLIQQKRHKGPICKMPGVELRLDGRDHLPFVQDNRGRCKMPGCSGIVNTMCRKCEVNLCIGKNRNCFVEFHTK